MLHIKLAKYEVSQKIATATIFKVNNYSMVQAVIVEMANCGVLNHIGFPTNLYVCIKYILNTLINIFCADIVQ